MADEENRKSRTGIEKDDKIALAVISGILFAVTIGILIAVKSLRDGVLSFLASGGAGVGWEVSFISSIFLSSLFIVLLALFAGDGVVGELGLMLVGFFVMLVFFTISIALIL